MKKPFRFIALLLVVTMLTALVPFNAVAAESLSGKTIIAFGDSLTANGSPAYTGYLSDLIGVDVINAGVGGNTSPMAYDRFQTDVLDKNPDIVLICLGMNDQPMDTVRNVNFTDIRYYEFYLSYFAETLLAKGVDVVFITPNPVCAESGYYNDPSETDGYTYNYPGQMEKYCDVMRNVAIKYGCGIVDINREFNALKESDIETFKSYYAANDGVHQNQTGREAWANYIAAYLKAAYEGVNAEKITINCVNENNKTIKKFEYYAAKGAKIRVPALTIDGFTTTDSAVETTVEGAMSFTFNYTTELYDLLDKAESLDYTQYSENILSQIRDQYTVGTNLLAADAIDAEAVNACTETLEKLLAVTAGEALILSEGKTYTRTAPNRGTWDDNLVILTDGVKGESNAESAAYAGWNPTDLQTQYGMQNHVDVTIDLGENQDTNIYNIYFAQYDAWAITAPDASSKFNVYVSDDGSDFTYVKTASTITSTTYESTGAVTHKVTLKADEVVNGRYVKVSMSKNGFVWIDEVEAGITGTAVPSGTAIAGVEGTVLDGTQIYYSAPGGLGGTDNIVAKFDSSKNVYIVSEVGVDDTKVLASDELIVAGYDNSALANAEVGKAILFYGLSNMIGAYFEITDVPAADDGADDSNLALNKTLTISGNGAGYYYDDPDWGIASYRANLNDGIAANSLDFNDDWFGFHTGTAAESNTVDGVGTVVIDLGADYDLSKVRTHFRNADMSGVKAPSSVVVSVATAADSETFTDIGGLDFSNAEEGIYWTELDCNKVGRYVKFTIKLGSMFAFLNELEVYGDVAAADDYNQPETPVTPETENLASGRDYEISGSNDPVIDPEYGTDYSANLTDGLAAESYDSTNGSWFIFSAYTANVIDGKGTVTIDFDKIADITQLKVHTGKMVEWQLNAPSAITAYGSVDGKTYTKIGDLAIPTDNADGTGFWATLDVTDAQYGSVRFEFTLNGSFALVNEIEVYGTLTETDYNPETSVTPDNDPANVALNKDYSNKTNIGDGENTSYGALLTDGVAAETFDYKDDSWFAFFDGVNASNGVGTVVIDLLNTYDISKVRLHLANYADASVVAPKSIKVYGSNDNVNFTDLLATVPTQSGENDIYWAESAVNVDNAFRYIKVEFTLDGIFAYVNEIEVYGVAGTAEDKTNLASGRDYNISVTNEPIVDTEYGTDYSANLTDGLAAETYNSADGSWFIFSTGNPTNVIDGKGTVTVDFDYVADITQFRVHTGKMVEWGVNPPSAIAVYGSVDGISYTKIGDLAIPTDAADGTGFWATLDVTDVQYGSVRFEFTLNGGYALVNEIQVYGKLTETEYPVHECSPDDSWDSDSENHWHNCACGEKFDEAAHTAGDWETVKEAEVGVEGLKEQRCTVCDYLMDEEVIPAEEHVCVGGEKWYSNKTNHWHNCSCGKRTDSAEHTAGDWEIAIEAQIGVAGLKEQRCTVCDYLMAEEVIPALENTPAEPEKIGLRGDVTKNGEIDSRDYVFLKRAYFGTYKLDETATLLADVNNSGGLDSRDYVFLKRAYFGTYKIPENLKYVYAE